VPTGARNWLTPAAWVGGTIAVLLLLFPAGFPNYDTIYSLLWGRELGEGLSPDRGAVLPPTPHPLAELLGLVTSPLGGGAIDATMVIAYLALGLTGYLVYRLGSLWFDRPIGAVAALIVLTRAPYLSNGLRAYVDLPYIALVLAALVVETKRPRTGWPVLALLALAGLLRPEAWLFAVAYWLYLYFKGERSRRELGWLGALALAGPILWALFDWVASGSPTYSFTGTRETVDTLARDTGPVDLVLYGPRRLGEVLQWPGMVGAAGGVLIAAVIAWRGRVKPSGVYGPQKASLGLAAAALALAAFAILACAGLAIIPRYTMLAAAVLAVFAALALLGWRLLEREHPWRRPWQAFAAIVALMFVVWAPNQYDLLHRVDVDLTNQGEIESDLNDLADSGSFVGVTAPGARPPCLPISVPNHRAVPRLAFDLDLRPSEIVSFSQQRQPRRGYFLDPASAFVVHNFVLDPNDPARLATPVPPGFRLVARNDSWRLYRRC
jgi:hypothetical protein